MKKNKVKGLRKLNKAISAPLVKQFGISKAICSDDYQYNFINETVYFKITTDTIEDILFNEFVMERFGFKVENSFIISIFHEIGHHKANDEIEGSIYNFCIDEKNRITEEMQKATTYEEVKTLEWEYFNLPDEIMATQWAVNYIKNHPKEIAEMWSSWSKAFRKFYKKNGVEVT